MIALLLVSLAFAQEPMVFDPIPADVGDLAGILVDEATYAELGALRVQVAKLEADAISYEEWRIEKDKVFYTTVTAIREESEVGQIRLTTHYEAALLAAKKKDALQRHGFTLGVAVGVVSMTALTVAVVNVYDKTLP